MTSPDVAARRLTRHWYELLVEEAPEAVVVLDGARHLILANRSVEDLLGYTREEIVGSLFDFLLLPRFHGPAGPFAALLTAATNYPIVSRGDLCGSHKDGTEAPLQISVRRATLGGAPTFILCISDISERKQAEEAAQHMSALVESADDAILTKTLDGIVRSFNPAATTLLGYAPEEIIGRSVLQLIPDARQDEEVMILEKLRRGERVAHFETVRRTRDGSLVDVSLTISPVRDRIGNIIGASKIMRDISERNKTLAQLRALNAELEQRVLARTAELKERETMIQEIHHRVKNNLQVISSLINMQARSVVESTTRGALRKCQSRIATMAQIHETLYQSADYGRLPFWKYAKELTSRILQAADTSATNISLQFELEPLYLSVDRAIPAGLILNEVVTNSLKHAFLNRSKGTITVGMRRLANGQIQLSIGDDGIGIRDVHSVECQDSLGLNLIRTLARQLDAQLEFIREPGTTIHLLFHGESS